MGNCLCNSRRGRLAKGVSFCLAALCLPLIFGPVRAADLSERQAAGIILSALQGDKQPSPIARLNPSTGPNGAFAAVSPGHVPLFVPYRISVDPVEVQAGRDKPPSYLFSLTDRNSADPLVGLARVDRVDIVELRKVTQNEYRAEIMVGYNMSSVGSILFGRAMQVERPGEARLRLLDDGWRLKLLKRF